MPSRREFLIGGGVVVALGLGGVVEMGAGRRRSVLHRFGLLDSPDLSVAASNTPIRSGSFRSKHMAQPVNWKLSEPAGGARGVVYCLHGHDQDERFAFDHIHLHDFAAAGHAPLAIAAVDGGADSYWHQRADGSDPMTMLLEEFVPLVESMVGPQPRAIVGWSMGGYGALLAAETAPQQFRAVCAASPALWTTPGDTPEGAFDDADDYKRNDVYARTSRLTSMKVRVDCGTGDPFYAATKQFVAQLHPAPQGRFSAGFHDDAYWRSVAPAQIQTIKAALLPA